MDWVSGAGARLAGREGQGPRGDNSRKLAALTPLLFWKQVVFVPQDTEFEAQRFSQKQRDLREAAVSLLLGPGTATP